MDTYKKAESTYLKFVNDHDLRRKAAIPKIKEDGEDGNPRVTKFGGKYPHLPNEEIPGCSYCLQDKLMMVVQLYINDLPEFIKSFFPLDKQDCLLVLGVCPQCMGSHGYHISTYYGDSIDQLEYSDDVGKEWSKESLNSSRCFPHMRASPFSVYDDSIARKQFFELNIIQEWIETEMVPYASNDCIKNLMSNDGIQPNQRMFLIANEINMRNNLTANIYLGGWPMFCEKDQTPENMKLLLNITESEAATLEWGNGGNAQIWMSTEENCGKFLFTCSSH